MKKNSRELVFPEMITPSMTAQQIFDYITHFLYKQGLPSYGIAADDVARKIDMSSCLYRGPENKMCAMGCIIPDKFYLPDMEGMDVDCLLKNFENSKGQKEYWQFVKQHRELLLALQAIHDKVNDASMEIARQDMIRGFHKTARDFNLQFDKNDYKVA
jgi:hypothetical protein